MIIFDYFFELLILTWTMCMTFLFYRKFYRINAKADDDKLMEKYVMVEMYKRRIK